MKNPAKKPPSNSNLSSLRYPCDLLASRSKRTPGVVVTGASDLLSLTHGGLLRNVEDAVPTLNDVSVSQNGSVAIVLPNRLELATGVRDMALGAPATALHSTLGQSNLDFLLNELGDQPHKEAPC